jgi:hypothetical protein
MQEVSERCSRCLEDWWCQWRTAVGNSRQLQQYGRLFLHRQHMDTENHYLYNLSMPVHLQQSLCCGASICGLGYTATGQVLHAHARVAQQVALRMRLTCCIAAMHMRSSGSAMESALCMHTVQATAKYVRHAMKLTRREDQVAQQQQKKGTHARLQAQDHTRVAVPDIQLWLCRATLTMPFVLWMLGVMMCLHSALDPMIGPRPNHMGPWCQPSSVICICICIRKGPDGPSQVPMATKPRPAHKMQVLSLLAHVC